ncbi:hypothetical protein DM02DRAFT_592461 [Periconia macrospinosa]|uniref:Uncharacterized protein n=1 Tax=Periconia macrospinosa TaxID=97972 RepID=A0A2V1DTQ7_9PLEO|nr:hypothetical protein DM02DRAFT_592461 [Periconia macrospinosa]
MNHLVEKLQDTPSPPARDVIIDALWPASTEQEKEDAEWEPEDLQEDLDWRPYFEYYENQCDHALHQRGRHIVVRTHQHIIDIARDLDAGYTRERTRDNLKTLFAGPNPPTNATSILDNSVDLAARLYLMINISENKSIAERGSRLVWKEGTLKDTVASHFSEPQVLSSGNIRFEKTFTACNLDRIAGIKFVPTDNLADHLRMAQDDKIVAVFHHASFLTRMKRQKNSIYPLQLIEETLRTLALLFPKDDAPTSKYLRGLPDLPPIDRHLPSVGKLHLDDRQIETYTYWHDRLVILKQAFDESRPEVLSQWWHDRRNGYQWYTFWVAVFVLFLTIFFGLVQSIEGAMQVYKAYHPT